MRWRFLKNFARVAKRGIRTLLPVKAAGKTPT